VTILGSVDLISQLLLLCQISSGFCVPKVTEIGSVMLLVGLTVEGAEEYG